MGVSSALILGAANTCLAKAAAKGPSSSLLAPTHCISVVRLKIKPAWAKIWHCRYSGRWNAYFQLKISASNEAPAKLFSIGRAGAGAWTMTEQLEQRFFGRICRVTVKVTVLTSSTSAVSEPNPPNGPPQSGQAHSLGLITLSIRSKCSGNCLRRVGCPFSGTTASMGAAGINTCATLAASASRPSAICSMPSIRSEDCPKRKRRSLASWNFRCSICRCFVRRSMPWLATSS